MLTKVDLETLAATRLEDAILLLDAGRSSSAYYLDSISAGSLIRAIADPDHGVFQWVKKHW